jgi:hypothetical protein
MVKFSAMFIGISPQLKRYFIAIAKIWQADRHSRDSSALIVCSGTLGRLQTTPVQFFAVDFDPLVLGSHLGGVRKSGCLKGLIRFLYFASTDRIREPETPDSKRLPQEIIEASVVC